MTIALHLPYRTTFMARLNLVSRQVYCLILMAGVFALQLAIVGVTLAALTVPAIVILALSIFPLSTIAWHTSRAIVRRMLAKLEHE